MSCGSGIKGDHIPSRICKTCGKPIFPGEAYLWMGGEYYYHYLPQYAPTSRMVCDLISSWNTIIGVNTKSQRIEFTPSMILKDGDSLELVYGPGPIAYITEINVIRKKERVWP